MYYTKEIKRGLTTLYTLVQSQMVLKMNRAIHRKVTFTYASLGFDLLYTLLGNGGGVGAIVALVEERATSSIVSQELAISFIATLKPRTLVFAWVITLLRYVELHNTFQLVHLASCMPTMDN